MKIICKFLLSFLVFLISRDTVGQIVVVEGRRFELGRIYYLNEGWLQGSGFFHNDENGQLKFIRHGYCIEMDEDGEDYVKAKYVNGVMEGEGEIKKGNYKYSGEFSNGEFHGLGTLTNLKTGKRQHGYFQNGKFVRNVIRSGPYMQDNAYAEDRRSCRNDLITEIYDAWSKIP